MTHTVYTAGYAAWTPAQLKAEVERRNAVLVDIRMNPTSTRPEWTKTALQNLFGVRWYEHVPALGNRNYRGGEIVLAAPERGVQIVGAQLQHWPVVLLCACRDAHTCHRSVAAQLLSEQLGATVEHLEAPVETKPGMIKALSLNPPFGSLIAAAAIDPLIGKQIETRGYPTSYRGRLAIHQTKGLGEMFSSEQDLAAFCRREPFRTALHTLGYTKVGDLPRGQIIAICDLVDCVKVDMFNRPNEPELSFGNYSVGEARYMWKLANIVRVEPCIEARGLQGLWDWTPPAEMLV